MKRLLFKQKGLFTLEYVVLIAVVAGALMTMYSFIQKCFQGRYRADVQSFLGGPY